MLRKDRRKKLEQNADVDKIKKKKKQSDTRQLPKLCLL